MQKAEKLQMKHLQDHDHSNGIPGNKIGDYSDKV